jgi:uncharacterized membrane protein YgcG
MSTLRFATLMLTVLLCTLIGVATKASATTMSEVLISATAPGELKSFSRSEYYIKTGGTPPTLEALAAEPRKFFRHEMAYQVFKRGFEIQLGKRLSDGALQRLLAGNKVKLRACTSRIYTTGVDRAGNVSWFTRSCAKGEQLLWLQVGNKQVVVASMGCLNLVDAPVIGPVPTPALMTGNGFAPLPACTGDGCTPRKPPVTPEPPCKGAHCKPQPPVTPPEPPVCKGNGCQPQPPSCTTNCEPPEPPSCKGSSCNPSQPTGQNPGNGKPVGNSPHDGITGNSGKNDAGRGSPKADPMDGQRDDKGAQPGGGQGPSDANGNQGDQSGHGGGQGKGGNNGHGGGNSGGKGKKS